MRNLKKVLALVLAMAMSLSLAVTASASYNTFDDQDKIENQEAVFLLNALDIVEGRETGDFDPAANINRAEAAKLVAALNLAGVPVPNAKGVSSFSDVLGDGSVAWANNYIEYCVSQGSVNGMGDGTFAPKANVTGVQFAKMLLGILGYEAAKEGYTGTNWMYNVNIDAVDAGLYKGLDIDATAALSRDDAAQMMYNALMAYTVIYLTDTTGAQENTFVTLLKDAYGANVKWDFGKITYIEYNFDKAEYTYNVNVDGETVKLVTKADYTDMLHMNVMYVVDGKDVLGVYAFENNVATGLVGDLDIADLEDDKIVDSETAFVKLTTGHDCSAEINKTDFHTLNRNNLGHDFYEYKAIDNDNDGTYDMVFVYEVNFETLYHVTKDSFKFTSNTGFPFETKHNAIYAGAAKDDAVAVTYDTSLKNWVAVEKLTAQSGIINNVYADNGIVTDIVIGGASYDFCSDMCGKIAGGISTWPGLTVDFYVINGYVVDMTVDYSLSRDYLLVTAIDGDYNADGYSVDATVLFGDNTTDVITIASLTTHEGVLKGDDLRNAILPYMEQIVGGEEQLGYLARYEVVDGKYELTSTYKLDQMVEAKVADLGFTDTAANYSATKPEFHPALNNTEDSYITIGSTVVRIAEDALVFLVDQDGNEVEYSAVSGADIIHMTGWGSNGWGSNATVNYVGYEQAANGFNYATLIYLQADMQFMSEEITGIVVSETKTEANENDTFVYFDLYDGEKTVKVIAKNEPGMAGISKGDIITFRTDDGKLQMVKPVKGDDYAITAYDPESSFAEIALSDSGYKAHEIALTFADDCQVIFFDSKNCAPATGEIRQSGADEGVDKFYQNAFAVVNNFGEITLLIIDPVIEGEIIINETVNK